MTITFKTLTSPIYPKEIYKAERAQMKAIRAFRHAKYVAKVEEELFPSAQYDISGMDPVSPLYKAGKFVNTLTEYQLWALVNAYKAASGAKYDSGDYVIHCASSRLRSLGWL